MKSYIYVVSSSFNSVKSRLVPYRRVKTKSMKNINLVSQEPYLKKKKPDYRNSLLPFIL